MQEKTIKGFRLSPQQRHLWSLQQASYSGAYRAESAVLIEGNLNSEAFTTALERLVERHEILRTTFRCLPEMTIPLQVIAESSLPSVRRFDLSSLCPREQEARLEELIHKTGRLGFDLEQGPLLRASLVHLSPGKHMLLMSLPALCADAVTIRNLIDEVSRLYATNQRGEELVDKPTQYVDFSEWQNELLQAEEAKIGIEFWRKQDLGPVDALKLPFEIQRLSGPEFNPESLTLTIDPDSIATIAALVRKYDASTSTFLLACWQILLARITGQASIIIGAACDGRTYDPLKGAVGLFAKYLPLHCYLDQHVSFREILEQTSKSAGDVYRWQDCFSWEQIAGSMKDRTTPAFFPFLFDFQEQPEKSTTADITFSSYTQSVCLDRFKVKLCCVRTDDSLTAELQYDSNMFLADDIERLGRQFQTLLGSVVDDPETPISQLNILSDSEKHQVLVEFNDTRTDYRKDKCIHQLFEEQAERTPDKIAVVSEDRQLTYGELNARSNQLAHHLQDLGVGPEVTVALCVERSLEMVIGLLGILKAGGAYVPLDPVLPKERLAFIVEDARPPVLLTQQRLVEGIPDYAGQVVCLDTDWNVIARLSTENPVVEVNSGNLAYVLFTSGSTGRPKGVAVEHRQLVNYLDGILQRLDLPKGASFATVSTLAADLGNTAIFPSLCNGGCLHVIAQERAMDSDALAEYFARHPIDCLKIVPSHLDALLNCSVPERVLPRKRLVLGGEVCSWALAEKVQALAPDCVMLNHYGPTETTVGVTTRRVAKGQTDPRSTTVPIGRPIANTEIYLLDGHMQPVPIWVAGELHIGGDGVARGYLNDAELTAEKFIANPFRDDAKARLYKTGDLCRYLPDGNIEFLGRMDDQVKIRGFRIELGEIEATLREHAAVRECVVVAREDSLGAKHLAAYVVARREQTPTATDLRNFLKARLPDYMVPSAIVFLDALPLTPNGKVARQALPPPDQTRREVENTFMAPRTPVEELVAGVWREVLKIERVGIHDSFFELGGHSLLATQVISRLREAFHIDLPLRSLFEAPTVSGLAERIEKTRGREQGFNIPPLLPASRSGAIPLSFAQQRLWFLDRLEPGCTTYNMSRAVRLAGPLNVAALERSVSEILRRHEALRTTFSDVDGQPFQHVSPAQSLSLPVIDLEHLPQAEREAEAQRLIKTEADRPFDLTHGPLFRVGLLRLGAEHHIFLYGMHHIVSDGWSMGVFFRELSQLYQAFSAGQPSPLTELPIQYPDFALWQRQSIQGQVLEQQLAYWKEQLAVLPVIELPAAHRRPQVQTYRGARQSLVLSQTLSDALRVLSSRQNATLFMTLLAAFQILLHRYTGQDDIAVGTPIAGRHRLETEGLIGFFLNTLVLRTNLSGNPSFKELLVRVSQVALGAYTHQDVAFEKLLEELRPERDLSRTPLFQVFFNMLAAMDRQELPGLTAEPLLSLEPQSKFDLTVYVREQNQRIRFRFVYNIDIFSQDQIAEMLGQLEHLLAQIVARPDDRIDSFSLVTPRAEKCLPNPTQSLDSDWECAVHTQFSRQAQKEPERLAVADKWETWTYKELDSRSNQLANYLLANGIQSQDFVAVYAHRSAPLVCAVLGILKAGAAFLILDPAYPASRLLHCLQEAKPRGWLHIKAAGTAPYELQKFVETIPCRVEISSSEKASASDALSGYSTDDPEVVVGPDDPACVGFTSGSTGRPKGVLGRHGSLSHFLPWQEETFHLSASDCFSMLSGLSHDPLQRDIFTPLWVGATLCVPDPEIIGSPKLARWMAEQQITFAHLTPAMGELLRETADRDCRIPSLRHVFFVGDKLTRQDVARFRRLAPGAAFITSYGTTETQRAVGYYVVPSEVEAQESSRKAVYPLGRGVKDAQLLVLNAEQRLAGVGELGEIYIRSPHLALGYLGDEALTKARFLPNPFTRDAGDRLYKTGDLGRYLPDGNVEFAGRADNQVKIHGFRIELAEVEAALGQHATVAQVVAMVTEDEPGEKVLIAYVVAKPTRIPTVSELRGFLKEKMPDYMIPSAFVMLENLPLTANGKVDYQRLPAAEQSSLKSGDAFVAPRTPAEGMLARVWATVLKLDQVGVHDNFFELGGHSMLAVRLFARIEKMFGKHLPIATIFKAPTIAQLAEVLRQDSWSNPWSSVVALQPHGSKPPFFWVHGENSNPFLPRYLGPDQPLYGIIQQSRDGKPALYTRVEDIAGHYLEEMRSVQPEGPYYLGGFCIGGTLAFEMAQQLRKQGQEAALLVLLDPPSPRYEVFSPSFSSRISNRLPDVTRLRDRLNQISRDLSALGPRDSLRRIRDGVVGKTREKLARLTEIGKMVVGEAYRRTGAEFPIPPWLRIQYINAVHRQAGRSYVPEAYPGRVVVLKSKVGCRDPRPFWGKLAGGGLEVIEIPVKHTEIVFNETQIRLLAGYLKTCLNQAQESVTAGKSSVPVNTDLSSLGCH